MLGVKDFSLNWISFRNGTTVGVHVLPMGEVEVTITAEKKTETKTIPIGDLGKELTKAMIGRSVVVSFELSEEANFDKLCGDISAFIAGREDVTHVVIQ
jgi:hypothetical protein